MVLMNESESPGPERKPAVAAARAQHRRSTAPRRRAVPPSLMHPTMTSKEAECPPIQMEPVDLSVNKSSGGGGGGPHSPVVLQVPRYSPQLPSASAGNGVDLRISNSDLTLTVVWFTLSVVGISMQLFLQRASPPFPPPPRDVCGFFKWCCPDRSANRIPDERTPLLVDARIPRRTPPEGYDDVFEPALRPSAPHIIYAPTYNAA